MAAEFVDETLLADALQEDETPTNNGSGIFECSYVEVRQSSPNGTNLMRIGERLYVVSPVKFAVTDRTIRN